MSLSSAGEKALRAFKDGAQQGLDSEALLQTCITTSALLEQWNMADSPIPAVLGIIDRVREQGQIYFDNLDKSISVATTLHELARDLKKLIDFLFDPGVNTRDIRDFICDIRQYTQSAQHLSERVSKEFRDVRIRINEITSDIPLEIKKLDSQEHTVVVKNAILRRRVQHARISKNVSTAALAIFSGAVTAVSVFPPLVLVLPIVLPIGILLAEAYEQRSAKKISKREDEIIQCKDGKKLLDQIYMALGDTASGVDLLINFWLRSDTMLETLYRGVEHLKGQKSALLKLKITREYWEKAESSYIDYAVKLKYIRDMACSSTSSKDSALSMSREEQSSGDLTRRNAVKSTSRHSSKGSVSRSGLSSR